MLDIGAKDGGQESFTYDGHVQPLNTGAELVGAEVVLVGDVQIEPSRRWVGNGFDMIHLLPRTRSSPSQRQFVCFLLCTPN